MALAEKLRRLSEMSLQEIRFRAAQKLRIAREQWQLAHEDSCPLASPWWRYWDVGQISDSALQAALKAGSESECAQLLPAYFAGRKAPRFYWDLASRGKLVTPHQHPFPNRTEELRAEADALCEHRFRIFAY